MWIEAVAVERIAELFENYQSALGIVGPKGSECGCGKESPEPEKTEITESRDHFAQPVKLSGAADSYRRSFQN